MSKNTRSMFVHPIVLVVLGAAIIAIFVAISMRVGMKSQSDLNPVVEATEQASEVPNVGIEAEVPIVFPDGFESDPDAMYAWAAIQQGHLEQIYDGNTQKVYFDVIFPAQYTEIQVTPILEMIQSISTYFG